MQKIETAFNVAKRRSIYIYILFIYIYIYILFIYIYTTLKFLALQGAPYIYDISRLKVNISSFERVEQFKYFGTTLKNQNSLQEEINSRLKLGTACYHSVQNLFFF
jgi:hypothetical protein